VPAATWPKGPVRSARSSSTYWRDPDDGEGSVEFHFTANVDEVTNWSAAGALSSAVGAFVSTLHARVAGVGSGVPETSANTANVCGPSARPDGLAPAPPDVHDVKAAPSSEHSKVAPGRLEVNVNTAEAASAKEPSAGPVWIVVSGAAGSTVHVAVAGVGSVFPAASTARTSNACSPTPRLE
jgi:hypothetical protein